MSLGVLIGMGIPDSGADRCSGVSGSESKRAATAETCQIAEEPTRDSNAPLTLRPTNTPTLPPEPTWTPLPPVDYVVKADETCSDIATAQFRVSIRALSLKTI